MKYNFIILFTFILLASCKSTKIEKKINSETLLIYDIYNTILQDFSKNDTDLYLYNKSDLDLFFNWINNIREDKEVVIKNCDSIDESFFKFGFHTLNFYLSKKGFEKFLKKENLDTYKKLKNKQFIIKKKYLNKDISIQMINNNLNIRDRYLLDEILRTKSKTKKQIKLRFSIPILSKDKKTAITNISVIVYSGSKSYVYLLEKRKKTWLIRHKILTGVYVE